MAVVLESMASHVQGLLAEMATKEAQMLIGVPSEIERMKGKLKNLKSFLADADRKKITSETVQEWVKNLRDAMYEATDIYDLYHLKTKEKRSGREMGCLGPLLFCLNNPLHAHKIGIKLKQLNSRLEDIEKRKELHHFAKVLANCPDAEGSGEPNDPTERETTGELDPSSVVGDKIEENTRYLVEKLISVEETNHEQNNIIALAIMGAGGIGKSTLARKIYNDEVIQQEFTKRIWLSVGQKVDKMGLLKSFIAEGGEHIKMDEKHTKGMLEHKLKEVLEGQKILLVMDDVWNHQEAWDDVLKIPLANAKLAPGSCVLITTRDIEVAKGMKVNEPFSVRTLNRQDSWSLLKKEAARGKIGEHAFEHLKAVGLKIIDKCDGLPLALKVMGGLLLRKEATPEDWGNVLKDESMWLVSQQEKTKLNYAVCLSYDDLRPSVKQCFLYYSLLPDKGIRLYENDIVGLWIAEGFISHPKKELEEVGREYYEELISRNLIEPEPEYNTYRVCRMHDVIRSFGQHLARNEALAIHTGETYDPSRLTRNQFLRLSLCNQETEPNVKWSTLQEQTSVRTFFSIGTISISPGDSLAHFSRLRTLCLYSLECDALVYSLCQLKHLRLLTMVDCNISELPKHIGKMKLLQFMSIRKNRSKMMELPEHIVQLTSLRTLTLARTKINSIPKGFKKLKDLRTLGGFPVNIHGKWCSLQELGPIKGLTNLAITDLQRVVVIPSLAKEARLREKERLTSLSLVCTTRFGDDGRLVINGVNGGQIVMEKEQGLIVINEVFDGLCPPPSLKDLTISGYFGCQLPRWMTSVAETPLINLKVVVFYDLACCRDLPDGLCRLPYLKDMKIDGAPAIERVGPQFLQTVGDCSSVAFPRLQKLVLKGMVAWKEWVWEEQVRAMTELEVLHLDECMLGLIPPGLAAHARALQELSICNAACLSAIENLASVVRLEVSYNPDLERIGNMPKLRKLSIVECPNMKELEGVDTLQSLEITDSSMVELPRFLRDVNPRQLLLECSSWLLTFIALGECGPDSEWSKFSHIQQVKVYAEGEGVPRKWCVLYTRKPYNFSPYISPDASREVEEIRREYAESQQQGHVVSVEEIPRAYESQQRGPIVSVEGITVAYESQQQGPVVSVEEITRAYESQQQGPVHGSNKPKVSATTYLYVCLFLTVIGAMLVLHIIFLAGGKHQLMDQWNEEQ